MVFWGTAMASEAVMIGNVDDRGEMPTCLPAYIPTYLFTDLYPTAVSLQRGRPNDSLLACALMTCRRLAG